MGKSIRRRVQYAEEVDELRRGHELGSKRVDWPYPSASWVARAERLATLADRLPAVLSGEVEPTDNAERLDLDQIAYDTKRYAAACLWAEALEADPSLMDDLRAFRRSNAACAAALAATGQGRDDPKPNDAARATFGGLALGWLKAELAALSAVLDSGDPQARAAVVSTPDTGDRTPTWPPSATPTPWRPYPSRIASTGKPFGPRWTACWRRPGRLPEQPRLLFQVAPP